jgi:hypothetical protein
VLWDGRIILLGALEEPKDLYASLLLQIHNAAAKILDIDVLSQAPFNNLSDAPKDLYANVLLQIHNAATKILDIDLLSQAPLTMSHRLRPRLQ